MWNDVFKYFIEIKRNMKDNFTLNIPFEQLIQTYGTKEQIERIENLEFRQHNNLLLIHYGDYSNIYEENLNNNSFWDKYDGFYRECRSLVIDLEKEQLVLTPLPKFLNMNESVADSEQVIIEKMKNAKVIEFSNKLDGSMISARYYDGEYLLSTSMALDKTSSWRLRQAYDFLDEKLKTLLNENPNLTFIFELISKEDAHVVKYDKEDYGLHLIGIRDVETGKISNYKEVVKLASDYNIKSTTIDNLTFDEVKEQIKTASSDNKEGWVLNIDGYRAKIKTDDYVLLHKTLSALLANKTIIKAIADNTFDDLYAKIPDGHKDEAMNVYKKVISYQEKMCSVTDELYQKLYEKHGEDRKSFMIEASGINNSRLKSNVMTKYRGMNVNYLKSSNGKYITMKNIENFLNA